MQTITIIANWLMEQMADIVADLWSIQLAIIGIAVSVMALLFALHLGKAETYHHISKSKDINDELMSIYLSKGMKTYQQLNSKIVAIFIYSSFLFLYSSVVKYINCETVVFWMGFADLLLTVALIVWTVCVIMCVARQYKKETK